LGYGYDVPIKIKHVGWWGYI